MEMKDWIRAILYVISAGLFLWYLFMPIDVVPDAVGIFGFFDDAVIALMILAIVKMLINRFKLGTKKKYFAFV